MTRYFAIARTTLCALLILGLALPALAARNRAPSDAAVDVQLDRYFRVDAGNAATTLRTYDVSTGELVFDVDVDLADGEALVGIELDDVTGDLHAFVRTDAGASIALLDPQTGAITTVGNSSSAAPLCSDKPVVLLRNLILTIQNFRPPLSAAQVAQLTDHLRLAIEDIHSCDLGSASQNLITFNQVVYKFYRYGFLTRAQASQLSDTASHVIRILTGCDCVPLLTDGEAGNASEPEWAAVPGGTGTPSAAPPCTMKPVVLIDSIRPIINRLTVSATEKGWLEMPLRRAKQHYLDTPSNVPAAIAELETFLNVVDKLYRYGRISRAEAANLSGPAVDALAILRAC